MELNTKFPVSELYIIPISSSFTTNDSEEITTHSIPKSAYESWRKDRFRGGFLRANSVSPAEGGLKDG